MKLRLRAWACKVTQIALAMSVIAFVTPPAMANTWQMQKGSKLEFFGHYQGEAFTGQFKSFTPIIVFDAKNPTQGKLDVQIDMGSADTADADRDQALHDSDFFWKEKFPKARFVTQSIRATGVNRYEAKANLTIRNKTRAIVFPFEFSPGKNAARLRAQVNLDRSQFDVGLGDWADPSLIAKAVLVKVDLLLKPAPAVRPGKSP